MIPRLIRLADRCRFIAACAAPVLLSLLLEAMVLAPMYEERGIVIPLDRLRTHHAADLEARFAAMGYGWPPHSVPRVALRRLPGDLAALPVPQKKALFFRAVLPLVLAENQRVEQQRELLQTLFAAGILAPDSDAYRLAARIARDYQVKGDLNAEPVRALLLRRVDTIPTALALAQAANESAWGTSRFARQGNSLFGQWTWVRGAGLVPLRRAPGKGHLVRSFPDLRGGVRAYFHNLNVGPAYAKFRLLRAGMRQAGVPLDPLVLATGLGRYSERGEVYVKEIRWLMRDNDLFALAVTLQPPSR